LNMWTPGDVYQPSQRQYPETIERFEYGGEYHVIKVNSWGYVRFDKWQIYLSETMIDQYIEFRPGPNGETFVACYRNFKIAEFDTEDGQLIHRSIARMWVVYHVLTLVYTMLHLTHESPLRVRW
jgi:hypothetical protein